MEAYPLVRNDRDSDGAIGKPLVKAALVRDAPSFFPAIHAE
jgi:hypothetical protein